jgi:excisionase family DNA binding protein
MSADTERRDRANKIRQVADRCQTSERQVWRWIAEGKLKAVRLGPRCIRVWDSEIDRFRAACANGGGS